MLGIPDNMDLELPVLKQSNDTFWKILIHYDGYTAADISMVSKDASSALNSRMAVTSSAVIPG